MLSSLTDLGGNSMTYGCVLFHCPNKNPFFSERLTEPLDTAHLLRSPGPESTCSCFVPVATAHVPSFSFQGDTRCMEGPLFLMTSAFCGHCVTSAVYDLGEVGSGVPLLQHSLASVSFCKMGSGSFCAAHSQQRWNLSAHWTFAEIS